MKKAMLLLSGLTSLSLISPLAFSTSGHDHSHWSSAPVHLVLVGAIVGTLMIATYAFKKHSKAKKQSVTQS